VKILLAGGRVIDPSQDLDRPADVLIVDGRISKIQEGLRSGEGGGNDPHCVIVDLKGMIIVPGLINMQTH
jgi:dihydroorotase